MLAITPTGTLERHEVRLEILRIPVRRRTAAHVPNPNRSPVRVRLFFADSALLEFYGKIKVSTLILEPHFARNGTSNWRVDPDHIHGAPDSAGVLPPTV